VTQLLALQSFGLAHVLWYAVGLAIPIVGAWIVTEFVLGN
jgi:hypothetical protein